MTPTLSVSYKYVSEIKIHHTPLDVFEKFRKLAPPEYIAENGTHWMDIQIGDVRITLFE